MSANSAFHIAVLGGLGIAPSADVGDKHAVFQSSIIAADKIIGQGKANPCT